MNRLAVWAAIAVATVGPVAAQSLGLTVAQQSAATVAPGRAGTLTGTVTVTVPLTAVTLTPSMWTPDWSQHTTLAQIKLGNLPKGTTALPSIPFQISVGAKTGQYMFDLYFSAQQGTQVFAQQWTAPVATAPDGCQPDVPPTIAGMHQTLNEIFQTYNTAYWNSWPLMAVNPDGSIYNGGTGGEAAYMPSAVSIAPSGGLILTAQATSLGGLPWTSGEVTDFGQQHLYGHFEARLKTPAGNGLWPAFWALPTNYTWPPEIDTVEVLGQAPNLPFFSLHSGSGTAPVNTSSGQISEANTAAACHTYSVDWTPGSLIWKMDGAQVYQITGATVPEQPMYWILNLGVASSGTWAKPADSTTPNPATMLVEDVYAYAMDSPPAVTPAPAVFGKTTLSEYVAHPGDTVRFTSSVLVGDIPLTNSLLVVTATGYGMAGSIPIPAVTLGNLPANATSPLVENITIPANAASGLYNLGLKVNAFGPNIYPNIPTAAMLMVVQ